MKSFIKTVLSITACLAFFFVVFKTMSALLDVYGKRYIEHDDDDVLKF